MKKTLHYILRTLLALCFFLSSPAAWALREGFFASNSVLSEGKWVKFPVEKTGMTLIPEATLRAMGFSDISKVNVYGTGGQILPESLEPTMSDDLPLLPSIRTDKGILFFAVDVTSWKKTYDVPFSHTINPYDTKSYYFLSDRPTDIITEMEKVDAPTRSSEMLTTFTERMVHEVEIAGPADTGRTLFGEDFRTNRTQSFPFTLSGLAGDSAIVKVKFASKASSASSILVSANGTRLPSTSSDQMRETTAVTDFCRGISSVKTVKDPTENLTLSVTYSATGTVSFARLDFIEVFYERHLRLQNGILSFYTGEDSDNVGLIEGCSAETKVWDVTVPYAPKEMQLNLSGTTGAVTLPAGHHEYIAFDPSKVSPSTVTWKAVPNQNIHAISVPDMVIITYDTYLEGARRIASLHEQRDGMKVVIVSPDDIYNEFSGGSADVTAFRKLLKMWYDRGNGSDQELRYCLLMGRAHYDNRTITTDGIAMGYRPMPIWQEPTLFTESGSYSTDSYIAMLDDCKPGFSMSSAKLRVAVGRLPVTNATQANQMAAKIEKYVNEPDYGAWRNKIMLIADDIDSADMADTAPSPATTFFDQSEMVYNVLRSSAEGKRYVYDRVYMDAFKLEYTNIGLTYPAAKSRMMANFNEGVVYTNYLGHANPRSWTHEKILEWEDINGFSNKNLSFLFGGTCEFARWDSNAVSGGELMVLNPTAGVIGMITPSRTVYITQNYQLNRVMAPYLFRKTEKGESPRFGDFFRRGMNDLVDSNKLRYCFLGDPAIPVPLPINTVEFTSIDGHEISDDPKDFPVIPALGKIEVEGTVCAPDGSIDENFSGRLELILFDAEKPVSTKDSGKGLDRVYNDRKTRLTTAIVKVEKGRWSARLLLPSEIENNYSPALISAYAWSQGSGDEAHGMTENLYVYGYNEDGPTDDKAPTIEAFYLNTPGFTDGGVVNANPVVFATLFDESGINISDAGIGHKMILTLDGKRIFSDVNTYFTADIDREGAGSLCYPLEDLEPGAHTLALSVWDNAGNSSTAELSFNVGAAIDPVITNLGTNVNPASTSVVFAVTIDRPNSKVDCEIEVFDLNGRNVWSQTNTTTTDIRSVVNTPWDLKDKSGVRVPRGIYIYRATVTTPEGTYTSKSRKLAVTAQ